MPTRPPKDSTPGLSEPRIASKPEQDAADDLRPEYSFDYRKARPNRFAGQIDKSQVVVMLDPDIAKVFTTPESVNAILRALITAMPSPAGKPRSQVAISGGA